MRNTTTNYNTYNSNNEKNPTIIVDFNGITRRWTYNTFGDISANEKKYLINMKANLGNIEPLEGFAEIEETSIEILDKDLDVADKLKDNDFEGRDVTIKVGFQELNEADFMVFPAQKVRNILQGKELLSWIFTARDAKLNFGSEIFRSMPQTVLTANITDTSTTLTVADSDSFILPSELPDAIQAGVVINNEVIRYEAKSLSTTFNTLTRGDCDTTATSHNDGDLVTQCLIFKNCDLLTAWLFILMTTEDGSGHAYYDLNQHLSTPQILGIGLGLGASEVDFQTIEKLGYKYFESDTESASHTIGFKPVIAHEWFREFIHIPTSTYPILNNGKVSVQSVDYLDINENYSAVDTLTDDDIVDWESPEIDLDNLINVIELEYDIHPITGQARAIKRYKLDDSVTQYGQNQIAFKIRHPNLDSVINTNYIADAICRRWFYLFGNQIGKWKINTKFSKLPIEPGDDLNITHTKFVDLISGSRGWTAKKSKVLSQEITIDDGEADFKLSGFTWEMFTRVSSLYTKNVIESSDIQLYDDIITFSTDNTATLEAADAYVDSTTNIHQVFIFWIDITFPGVGSPSQAWHTIDLGFHVQDTTGPSDFISDSRKNIRYDPTSSATERYGFMLTANTPITGADRYKVDWFGASASAASGERPSLIKFYELWRITLNADISEL